MKELLHSLLVSTKFRTTRAGRIVPKMAFHRFKPDGCISLVIVVDVAHELGGMYSIVITLSISAWSLAAIQVGMLGGRVHES